jgi:hypothetical protein
MAARPRTSQLRGVSVATLEGTGRVRKHEHARGRAAWNRTAGLTLCRESVPSRGRAYPSFPSSDFPRNEGVRGSNPRVGFARLQGFLGGATSMGRPFSSEGVHQGSTRCSGGATLADRFTDRDAPSSRGVAHDVRVGAGGEAGIGVAEVLGDLVERPAFVEEQRRAGVAKVVAAEVGNTGALERRDPDSATPVMTA